MRNLVRRSQIWFLKNINKSKVHWILALSLIFLGLTVSHWASSKNYFLTQRYRLYKHLLALSPHRAIPNRTALVLITDEEFWIGELERRYPLKRPYLAKLLLAVAECNPEVMAVDFRLTSPKVDGTLIENMEYKEETENLISTIKNISETVAIVLPRSLMFDSKGKYVKESAIYDTAGFNKENVREGFISLPNDIRQIPLQLTLANGTKIDSLSAAIVRSSNPKALEDIAAENSMPFGGYMPESAFKEVTFSAEQVLLRTSQVKRKLAHKLVIVSGSWHERAYMRGSRIDTHDSPFGEIPGAAIIANHVEAILGSRTYAGVSKMKVLTIEFIISLIVALIFGLSIRPKQKMLLLFSFCFLITLLTYLMWQNLGFFFDSFLPVVFLGLHAFVEQILLWRSDALKWNTHKLRMIRGDKV